MSKQRYGVDSETHAPYKVDDQVKTNWDITPAYAWGDSDDKTVIVPKGSVGRIVAYDDPYSIRVLYECYPVTWMNGEEFTADIPMLEDHIEPVFLEDMAVRIMQKKYSVGQTVTALTDMNHPQWGAVCLAGQTGKVEQFPYGNRDFALISWDNPLAVNDFPMQIEKEIVPYA